VIFCCVSDLREGKSIVLLLHRGGGAVCYRDVYYFTPLEGSRLSALEYMDLTGGGVRRIFTTSKPVGLGVSYAQPSLHFLYATRYRGKRSQARTEFFRLCSDRCAMLRSGWRADFEPNANRATAPLLSINPLFLKNGTFYRAWGNVPMPGTEHDGILNNRRSQRGSPCARRRFAGLLWASWPPTKTRGAIGPFCASSSRSKRTAGDNMKE